MRYIKRLLPAVIISCILFNTFQLSFAAETSSYNILAKAYEEMPKAAFSKYEYGWADFQKAEDPGISEGVLAGKISDFDRDGKNELLVLKIKKYTGTAQDNYIDPYSNDSINPYYLVCLEIYEAENGTAVLADAASSLSAFDNMNESGGIEFFTKGNYIALQTVTQNNVFADGTMHQASIYEYNNKKLITKYEFNEGGSSWYGTGQKFAGEFKNIGFDGTADFLNDNGGSPYFTSNDGFNLAKLEKNVNQIFEMYITNNKQEVNKTIDYSEIPFNSAPYYIKGERMKIHISNFTDIKMPDIKVLLNGEEITFEQPPYIENGTTLVPMRAIFEALGASVSWNSVTQTVTANKDDTEIILTLNENTATVSGRSIYLTAPAKLVNGFTVVPLRFVGESLGAEVSWDGATRTVAING